MQGCIHRRMHAYRHLLTIKILARYYFPVLAGHYFPDPCPPVTCLLSPALPQGILACLDEGLLSSEVVRLGLAQISMHPHCLRRV